MRFVVLAVSAITIPAIALAQATTPPTAPAAPEANTPAAPTIVFLPPPPPEPTKSGDVIILPATSQSTSGPQSPSSGQAPTAVGDVVLLPNAALPPVAEEAAPLPSGPGVYFAAAPDKPETAKRIPMVRAYVDDKYRIKVRFNFDMQSPMHTKLVLPGSSSSFAVPSGRPTFMFLGTNNAYPSGVADEERFVDQQNQPVDAPFRMMILRFEVNGGERKVWAGAQTMLGDTNKPSKSRRVRFSSAHMSGRLFRVTLDQDLTPGEYAFVITPRNSTTDIGDSTISNRVYPFSVR